MRVIVAKSMYKIKDQLKYLNTRKHLKTRKNLTSEPTGYKKLLLEHENVFYFIVQKHVIVHLLFSPCGKLTERKEVMPLPA